MVADKAFLIALIAIAVAVQCISGDSNIDHLKKLCGAKHSSSNHLTIKEINWRHNHSLPASFDAREHWWGCPSINSIKYQGHNCSSGWAVSVASAVSDRLCIESNFTVQVNISAQNLLSCCANCTWGYHGCDGGDAYEAWAYVQSTGVVTGGGYRSHEGCQPYEHQHFNHSHVCHRNCTNKNYTIPYEEDLHFDNTTYLLPNDTRAIQHDIFHYGPVVATFDVYEDFLNYTYGVYNYTYGSFVGTHAVKVLGWGNETGTPYWLAANSWGYDWGDYGVFKILRGSNACNFESFVTAGVSNTTLF